MSGFGMKLCLLYNDTNLQTTSRIFATSRLARSWPECIFIIIYWPQSNGRLSWSSWLTHSGEFTHKLVTCQPQTGRRAGKGSWPETDVLATKIYWNTEQQECSHHLQSLSRRAVKDPATDPPTENARNKTPRNRRRRCTKHINLYCDSFSKAQQLGTTSPAWLTYDNRK